MPRERRDHQPGEDGFDLRIREARPAVPPADLLERCLATLPAEGVRPQVAHWLRGGPVAGAGPTPASVTPLTAENGMKRTASFWSTWAPVACAAAALVAVGSALALSSTSAPTPGPGPVARKQPVAAKSAFETAAKPSKSSQQSVEKQPVAVEVASVPAAPSHAVPAVAAPETPAGWIREHVAAGEFGKALEVAQQVKAAASRDALLAEIAQAQFQAGEYEGSLSTAGKITSDVARSEALAGIGALPSGAAGGGIALDYDTLIDLIINSAGDRASWDDQGGTGTVRQFPQGVYVDVRGLFNRRAAIAEGQKNLIELRQQAAGSARSENAEVRKSSNLRKVSLNRLEKFAQLRAARGLPPTEDMAVLAGLQRVQYIFVYPETNDVVLAGPAGDWATDAEGRKVSTETGSPVVLLDDFVVVSRYVRDHAGLPFGCLIDPRRENLAKVQEFIQKSSQRSLKPGERDAWLSELRDVVGQQDVRMIGPFDATTHAARVMVEADHHMKLVGIGLEEGTVDVPSYLDMLKLKTNEAAPPMGVLRWWFTLNYQAVQTNAALTAFQIRGQAVQVKSEDMLLRENGEKVGTGKSNELNQAFAHNFTTNFDALAAKYPVYAELRNLFDLTLVAGLMHVGGLDDQAGWHQSYFLGDRKFAVQHGAAPTSVESVINHKVYHNKTIVAQVSGGVSVDPWPMLKKDQLEVDRKGTLDSRRDSNLPVKVGSDAWWWD